MKIKVLPQEVVGKIAAGEVITRPADVVKQLVENSIDANATRITVNLQAGGSELIRVVDDGIGISEDELPIALARYTTSKLAGGRRLTRRGYTGFSRRGSREHHSRLRGHDFQQGGWSVAGSSRARLWW